MNTFKKIFSLIILTACAHVQAVIYQARILYNPATEKTIYALSDIHKDTTLGMQTDIQQAGIIAGALMHDAAIIDEDIGSYSQEQFLGYGLSKNTCQEIEQQYKDELKKDGRHDKTFLKFVFNGASRLPEDNEYQPWLKSHVFTPLYNLLLRCDDHHIAYYNAEFRYPGTVSLFTPADVHLRDVLTVNNKVLADFTQVQNPIFKEYLLDLKEQYDNHPVTKTITKRALQQPMQKLADIKSHDSYSLNMYDSPLLNGALLVGIEHFDDYQKLIVTAGGNHIDAIVPLLHDDGYQEVATFGGACLHDETEFHSIIPVVDLEDVFTHNLTTTQLAHGLWNSTKTVMSYLV